MDPGEFATESCYNRQDENVTNLYWVLDLYRSWISVFNFVLFVKILDFAKEINLNGKFKQSAPCFQSFKIPVLLLGSTNGRGKPFLAYGKFQFLEREITFALHLQSTEYRSNIVMKDKRKADGHFLKILLR